MRVNTNELFDHCDHKYEVLSERDYLNLWNQLRPYLDTGKRYKCLEIGCGSCAFSEKISKKISNSEFYGIDLSFSMLTYSTFPCARARAERLPFKNDSFDIVFAPASLHHFDLLYEVIADVKRCLKKGGLFFSYDPNIWHPQRMACMTTPLRHYFYRNSGDRALSKCGIQKKFSKQGFEFLGHVYFCFYNPRASSITKFNYYAWLFMKEKCSIFLPFVSSWFSMAFRLN